MTVEEIKKLMKDYPGEPLPLPSGGWIDPQCAIDILNGKSLELLDALKSPSLPSSK